MLLVAFSYERPFPKGSVTRPVPIHPTLASLLAEWKLRGWEAFMGRRPNDDDLVLPLAPEVAMRTKLGAWRRKEWVHKHFAIDLAALGMRHRRGHDLRRTFISLARSDGADTAILRRATHKPTQEVIEGYTTFLWDVVCREVAKLKVERRATGKLLRLPKVG